MTTRRRVLHTIVTTIAGLALWQKKSRAEEPEESAAVADSVPAEVEVSIPFSEAKGLAEVGGSAVVTAGGHTLLVARVGTDSVRAFESRCTHKQVTLRYDHRNARLTCPAHGSRFDLAGGVTKGPAKEALRTYEARLTPDGVVVKLPK